MSDENKKELDQYFLNTNLMQKEIDSLKSQLADTRESNYGLAQEIIEKDRLLEEQRRLLQKAVEALEYCSVEPDRLRPENNRQCAVAMNALEEIRSSAGGGK